ncbi:MAG: enoyl-CoA hydratase-related protein [Pseudomonadota bacterium]
MTALPETNTLDLALEGGWLTIWLNVPDKQNALTNEMQADLRRVFAEIRDERSVRGITLRGRGGVFCSGGDLKQFKAELQTPEARDSVVAMSRDAAALFDAVNTAPQVVIALIEGAAMAGGFGLACCADTVICAEDAKFSLTETMIGLTPAQIAPFIIQKMGYATARRLMLTAARFKGAEAKKFGFADFVGADINALETAEQNIKRQVLKCAPGAVADIKALILETNGLERDALVKAAAENFADRMVSDEARAGIQSFFDKTPPPWVSVSETK